MAGRSPTTSPSSNNQSVLELVALEQSVSNASIAIDRLLCANCPPASADRRPVDPPPVVELKVYEGEGPNRTDITFSYDANFFCFATLRLARPIAHGRTQQPPQQPPVLTGMPASGMAYLDRPAEAGYFIFPDQIGRASCRERVF